MYTILYYDNTTDSMRPIIAQIGLMPLTWISKLDGTIPFDQSAAALLNQANIDGVATLLKVVLPEGLAEPLTEFIRQALLKLQVPTDTDSSLALPARSRALVLLT